MQKSAAAARLPFWGGLALCVLVGALHLADAVLFLDAATGFAARGPAMARCAVWAVTAALLWWLGRGLAACPQPTPRSTAVLKLALRLAGAALAVLAAERLAFAGQMLALLLPYVSAAANVAQFMTIAAVSGLPGILAAGLAALLAAVWLLWPGPRALAGPDLLPAAGTGLLLLPWPFWLALQRFLVEPAAVGRLPATLRALDAAALLLFAAALLRAAYLPAAPNGPGLYRAGMLCFFFGACLELPQTLFELAHSAVQFETLLTGAAAGLLGIAGLVAAWRAAGPAKP